MTLADARHSGGRASPVEVSSWDLQLSHLSQGSGGDSWAWARHDIMSAFGPNIPLWPPITPPVGKKGLFHAFRSPKFALLTPLFPPKSPKNHPFCAQYLAFSFGQSAPYSSPSPLVPRHSPVVSGQRPPHPRPLSPKGARGELA